MPNEKPNIEQNIITPPTGDREKEKRLLEALKAIPDEEIIRLGEERDKEERLKEEAKRREEEKKFEIPQELEDFRKKWEQEIDLDNDIKRKIIGAVNEIPHRATIESDGSRLVEFELGGKRYKCLDVNMAEHSDSEYLDSYQYNRQRNNEVTLGGMWGDDTSKRKNRKLADFVDKQRDARGIEIKTIEFQRDLINKLGNEAGLANMKDKIAIWMYLTGNYGDYWLSMGDSENSNSQANSRSLLKCRDNNCYFNSYFNGNSSASLCMIACEGDDGEVTPKVDSDPEQEMIDFFSSVNGNPKYHY